MKRAALNDLTIRKAKAKEKRYFLTDGRGLGVEVMPTGNKYWRLIYRVDGKRHWATLGEYPGLSIVEARELADRLRVGLSKGIMPRDVLNPPPAPTFRAVAEDWLKAQEGVWSEGHASSVRYRLARFLYPALGERPMREITAPELLAVLRPIEGAGTPETARRCKHVFGQVARFAVASGIADFDVSASLAGALAAKKPAQRMAALTKPDDIKRLLAGMEAYKGSPVVRAAMWFSLYTLGRPGEVRHAEWAEVDLERALWEIPAEKMKGRRPHSVPLSRQAMKLLEWLRPLTGHGPYIFPSARSPKGLEPMSDNGVRLALRSMGFTPDEMTPHGFRSLGSTMLNELGYRPDLIEAALAHAMPGVRGIYNRSAYLEERRGMMQGWADWLDGLMGEGK